MNQRNLSAALGMSVVLACGSSGDLEFDDFATRGPDSSSLGFVDDSVSGQPSPARTCGGTIVEPERLPLDMYFVVDSSGSMAEPATGGATRWDLVTGALVKFLADPKNASINAGIGYFPEDAAPTCTVGQAGCLCIPFINICFSNIGGSCQPADYAAPAVPLLLPPAPTRLIDDIRQRQFAGGTPTRAALEGAYQYLDSWNRQNPGRKVVAVLATDGEPTGCPNNDAVDVANVAAAALAGPSQIQTFVIGVGGALGNLNQVARAGGTGQAFLTDASTDLSAEFSAALEAIRGAAVPCAFGIPNETAGQRVVVDPNLVNVRLTPKGADQASVIAKTFGGSVAGCDANGGWHYDNPAAPTRIELCASTCAIAVDARVEVEFGCATVVQSPR